MDGRGYEPRYARTYSIPPGVIPAGHYVTDGGWVVPAPLTAAEVRQLVQEVAAEVRQQLEGLRAEVVGQAAPSSSSATRINVGENAVRPAMLDVRACASMLGISVRSWQRQVERGDAPGAVKIGKSTRWRRSDVEAFIASRR